MIFDNGENGSVGGGAVDVGDIKNSLRFRAASSADMNRAMTTGNGSKYTLSWAMKIGVVPNNTTIFEAGTSATTRTNIGFSAAGNLQFYDANTSTRALVTSTATFRDVGGWYFFTVIVDTTLATATDRVILMCNGVRLAVTISTQIPINTVTFMNGPYTHRINGLVYTTGGYNDCYMARICFVDGAASPATSFGYLNTTSNAWVTLPQSTIKSVVDAGGINSFMLDFDNGASLTTLGADKSIKGNNWTLNNMSITAGATYDWMLDTPSNNFSVLNSITGGGAATYSNANLQAAVSNGPSGFSVRSTFFVSTGKWYFENSVVSGANIIFGVGNANAAISQYLGLNTNGWGYNMANGNKVTNGVSTAYGATVAIGDVVGVALDMDLGTLTFYKNGVSQGVAFTGLVGPLSPMLGNGSSTTVNTGWFNYGQRPFAFTPPTGFLPLCTQNLPTPNTAALTPPNQFNIALDTGASIKTTSEALFPNNFFEWIKNRGAVDNHQLVDIVRGNTAVLQSNTMGADTTYIAPANASVGWVWKAGGTAVTNTAGSVSSQVSANPDAGFSIVTFNAGAAGNKTVGHGLGGVPDLWIVKDRQNSSSNWSVGGSFFGNPAQGFLGLNLTSAAANDNRVWANTAPTNSLVSFESGYTITATNNAVMYLFKSIPGYSKIGTYVGNGGADGPFIYCGFRPRYVLIKRTDAAGASWNLRDTSRNPSNTSDQGLFANLVNADSPQAAVDILSNGFKMRDAGGAETNTNGGVYLYYAIAESTFNYSNAR